MQIAPLATVSRIQSPLATAPTAHVAPTAPVAPAAGFDHIFDFDGVAAGQKFHMDKGSTVNGWGISGEGRLDALTPTSATVWVRGGKFGFHKEATISVQQTSPTTVHLEAAQPGQAPVAVDADIVEVRKGYSKFHPTSVQAADAVLQMDSQGRLVLDVDDALDKLTFHLVLAKDAAEAVQPAAA